MKKPDRNDPCPCGSGKKYKQCCLKRDEALVSNKRAEASSLEKLLREALAHHQAGRLPQAEAIYRHLLKLDPNHPEALHLSGVVAHQRGDHETAVTLINQAVALNPTEATYHSNLGSALQAQGELAASSDCYRKALALKPNYVEARYNLGNALKDLGKLDEAVEHYQKALAFKPNYAEVYNNLGIILKEQGKLGEALQQYRKALTCKPDFPEAQNNMGLALQDQDQFDAAAACYQRAIELKPDYFQAYYNLGNALKARAKPEAAIAPYLKALMLKADSCEAHLNLAGAYQDLRQLESAAEHYGLALAIKPDYIEALNNLGTVFREQGKLEQAVECYRQALSLKPDLFVTYNNLGTALKDQGKLFEAVEIYQKAIQLKPDFVEALNSLLFLYGYHALIDPREYLAEACGWEQACLSASERQTASQRTFQRPPLAARRLKVAYVSGDYRQHAISYFIEQVFANHDNERIELYAYYTCAQRDAVTKRLQSLAEHWVSLAGMSDTAIHERIAADGIDVLIDLSGHTLHNRMGVFARRAAPVQAHYLGYFASTGLSEMDYWIGDEILTPVSTDSHFNEQVWRLPRVWVCYNGKVEVPVATWQPSQDGTVWLGSFNNLGKLSPDTLCLWAKLLHALPEAKLLLKTRELCDSGNRQRILDTLLGNGIAPARIELQDSSVTPDWMAHMSYYNRLDIALDPVGAVGGGTTTCDALWMGVPVIACEGDRMATRMTPSMLHSVGHPEWIASTEEDYIDKVVALARDKQRLIALRSRLREQMAGSPLCDARGLARSLEQAYFEMFKCWQVR